MTQFDLFADRAAHSQAHLELFSDWAASASGRRSVSRLSQESHAVYLDMWTSLVRWCAAERVDLREISAAELDAYLKSRAGRPGKGSELEDRYAWRMLRLVERVLGHRARAADAPLNRSVADLLFRRPSIRFANSADADPLPEHLDAGESRLLVAHLARPDSLRAAGDWKSVRDRCAVSLHLGAGLTPFEVRALRVSDVHGLERGTRKIRVASNGSVPPHEAPVAGWAWRCVRVWLDARSAIGVPGDVLLPATRSGGGPWGKTGHYEAVKGVMAVAGLNESGGAYRLRHTFALRQLKRGHGAATVAGWMGVDESVIQRYRHVVYGDVEIA